MKKLFLSSVLGSMAMTMVPAVQAAMIMPDFANVPTGWTTDRYEPNSFSNVGTYQGRNDVLGIGISRVQGLDNRPGAFQSQFYNTQGRQHAISGGVGSVLSAALFIEDAWQNAANGNVRTDMWGAMNSVDHPVGQGDYPIIGFTNYGGAARLRAWDGDIGWVDLATPVDFGAWTDLSIEYTGTTYAYRVNDALVYTDSTIDASTTGFMATIMQAYNFCGDQSLPGAVCSDYTAHWANSDASQVPTPASLPLVALALLMLSTITWKRRPGAGQVLTK